MGKLLSVVLLLGCLLLLVGCSEKQITKTQPPATPQPSVMFIEAVAVDGVIKLRWRIPLDVGSNLRLDWKRDDGDDANWPSDYFNGGVLDFADDVNTHEFVPVSGVAYAFRTRRVDTGETSNIVRATAP